MFQRIFRLLGQSRGIPAKVYTTPSFTLRITRQTLPHTRIGIVISKKIDKRATTRNRIKRIFRSELEAHGVHRIPGYDMLFLLKKGILVNPRQSGQEALTLLRSIHILS